MSMHKMATHIAQQQYTRLQAIATRLGVTQAELLRRFLEEGLRREERQIEAEKVSTNAPYIIR